MPATAASSPAGNALPSASALTIASRAGSPSASAIRENPVCTDWDDPATSASTANGNVLAVYGMSRNSFQVFLKHQGCAVG
jgi:hypothetical protein